jgi:hypothetical protein
VSFGQQVVCPLNEHAISSDEQPRSRASNARLPTPAVAEREAQYDPPASSSQREVMGQQIGCPCPLQNW